MVLSFHGTYVDVEFETPDLEWKVILLQLRLLGGLAPPERIYSLISSGWDALGLLLEYCGGGGEEARKSGSLLIKPSIYRIPMFLSFCRMFFLNVQVILIILLFMLLFLLF